eukprot:gene21169-32518_t
MHGRGEGLPGDHSVFTAAKPKPNEKLPNGKYRHIGSLSWSELCVLQWNGDDFNRSHSQRWVYVPFIPGHDSDSDLEYEPIPLQTINGHVTSPVYVGGGGVPRQRLALLSGMRQVPAAKKPRARAHSDVNHTFKPA